MSLVPVATRSIIYVAAVVVAIVGYLSGRNMYDAYAPQERRHSSSNQR